MSLYLQYLLKRQTCLLIRSANQFRYYSRDSQYSKCVWKLPFSVTNVLLTLASLRKLLSMHPLTMELIVLLNSKPVFHRYKIIVYFVCGKSSSLKRGKAQQKSKIIVPQLSLNADSVKSFTR